MTTDALEDNVVRWRTAPAAGATAPFEAVGTTLPPTGVLLVAGGDDRISHDPVTGLNKYGCAALPDPGLLSFASATATAIHPASLRAAETMRARLVEALRTDEASQVYACATARLKAELLELNGLSAMPGLEAVFAGSGTDLHLIASRQVFGPSDVNGVIIMVEHGETGSGVHAALRGRHFNRRTSLGRDVAEGAGVGADASPRVCAVDLRRPDGRARAVDEVDDDVEALVVQAMRAGQSVMLVLADQSRSGLLAPSPRRAMGWCARFGDRLTVMVDACQFRIAPATLQAYLEQRWLVAVTGSKFLGGPPFSGALLVPAGNQRFDRMPEPALAAYSWRADWPASWDAQAVLRDGANFGLLLRWEAAMHTLRCFSVLQDAAVSRFMAEFARGVREHLGRMQCIRPMGDDGFDRSFADGGGRWDEMPSIFPLRLVNPFDGRALTCDQTLEVHRSLSATTRPGAACAVDDPSDSLARVRCQFGQPVPMGTRGGMPWSALRLCLGAVHINQAITRQGGALLVIEQALLALDKLEWTVQGFCR